MALNVKKPGGDERVSYSAIPNAPTTSYFGVIEGGRAVGRQFEEVSGLIAMIIANDGILHHLVNGEREEALAKLKADLRMKTWMVRIFGTVAVVMGFFIFFSVFMSLLYRIPVLGNFVEYGVFLFSAVLGLTLSLLAILSGLVFHNPLTVALPLALLVGGVFWFLRRSRVASRNAKAALDRRMRAQEFASSSVKPPPPPPGAPKGPAPGSVPATDAQVPNPPPETSRSPAQPPAAPLSGRELIEHTFVNLAALALSEGKLSKKENRFLIEWGKENGINGARMQDLFAQARNDPPEMHHATKDDLEILALMAMADGVLSTPEWNFLWKIADRLDMKPQDLREMLLAIEKGAALPA